MSHLVRQFSSALRNLIFFTHFIFMFWLIYEVKLMLIVGILYNYQYFSYTHPSKSDLKQDLLSNDIP